MASRVLSRLLPGFVAALVMAAVMLLARLLFGAPSLPEVLMDRATALLPLSLFRALLGALGVWAKPLLVLSLLTGQVIVLGLLGTLWLRWLSRWGKELSRWLAALGFSLLLWAGALAAPPARDFAIALSWLPAFLVYGSLLAAASRRGIWPLSLSRRRLLVGLSAAGGLALVLGLVSRFLLRTGGAQARPGDTPEVTPNQDFYSVSKNFTDPAVDAATWKLSIGGLVERPFSLTYEDLLALPWAEQFLTLECISNEVGGDLIGNARWRGVKLGDLLRRAGVRGGIKKVVLRAADGYADSITLEKALEPGTLLVYLMNGEPLPLEHGFPARLLVPGIYGMKNAKWLTAVELVDYNFQGYWQERGWSDEAVILTMSRIDFPRLGEPLPTGDTLSIDGIAFAGDWGISQVEVSADGGKSWLPAQIRPALSPYTWVIWTREWSPPPGTYTLKVRAADEQGQLQFPIERESLPDGATGYHTITVQVLPRQP